MTDRLRTQFEVGSPRVTRVAAAHLLGLIEPPDIAKLAVLLASDESRRSPGMVVDSGIITS
jgi:hypothetical protein